MADYPAPQSAPGTATAPVSAGVLAYALFAIAAVLEIAKTGFLAPAAVPDDHRHHRGDHLLREAR